MKASMKALVTIKESGDTCGRIEFFCDDACMKGFNPKGNKYELSMRDAPTAACCRACGHRLCIRLVPLRRNK